MSDFKEMMSWGLIPMLWPQPDDITIEQGKVSDLRVTASTYGNTIPLIYGAQNRVAGNVIWSTGLIERSVTKKEGGKGGSPETETTNYYYSLSCAIALGAGPFNGIGRIWANSKLLRDSSGKHPNAKSITFYPGNTTQLPDPTIESYEGSGNVSAYRGISYVVINTLQLADYGNRLPNIEIEVDGSTVATVGNAILDICNRAGVSPVSVAHLNQPLQGFVVEGKGDPVSALSVLGYAFNFDLAEQAGQFRCVPRGRAMKGTMTLAEMGAFEGNGKPVTPIELTSETEVQMPKEVSVKYPDPAIDYQTNVQRSFRDRGQASNNLTQEVSVTMNPTQAARVADRLLWERWTGRRTAKYRTTDLWVRVQPGDILGVPVDGQVIPYKLTKVTRGNNGMLNVEAERDDPEVYASNVLGTTTNRQVTNIVLPGVTHLVLLDMPILRGMDDDSGYYWAVTAASSGWRGASIKRSTNGGVSYSTLSGIGIRTDIGTISAATPSGPTDLWDDSTVITVVLDFDSGGLVSATEEEVLNGANVAWIGPSSGQGGEVIQFKTATLTAPLTYQLSGLLRGRAGTEDRISTHGANETFVLMDQGSVGRSDFGLGDWNRERLFKPVSTLTEEADTSSQAFTNTGRGKLPYSPVHVEGTRDGSNNLTITWIRRTRLQVPGLGYGSVPLGETAESYDVDVYSGSTVVRTISVSAETASYTAAQQTADGLTPGNPVTLRVYQISETRGRGTPAIATV